MKEEFIKFLKSKRLWNKFKREFGNYDNKEFETLDVLFTELNNGENYICSAFIWERSEDGHNFWSTIRTQWQEHLKKDISKS